MKPVGDAVAITPSKKRMRKKKNLPKSVPRASKGKLRREVKKKEAGGKN